MWESERGRVTGGDAGGVGLVREGESRVVVVMGGWKEKDNGSLHTKKNTYKKRLISHYRASKFISGVIRIASFYF